MRQRSEPEEGVQSNGNEQFEVLATVADVPEGALLAVQRANGEEVCLFNDRGTIGAVQDCCSHADFKLSDGVLHADGTLECVWHGARFDCRTGAARKAPAFDPVPVYEVRVEDGKVLVGPRRQS